MKIFHHYEGLDQWEPSLDYPGPMRVAQTGSESWTACLQPRMSTDWTRPAPALHSSQHILASQSPAQLTVNNSRRSFILLDLRSSWRDWLLTGSLSLSLSLINFREGNTAMLYVEMCSRVEGNRPQQKKKILKWTRGFSWNYQSWSKNIKVAQSVTFSLIHSDCKLKIH